MIVKQMDVRSNIRKYFDIAYEGEAVIVPRKQDHNVVIISEAEYNKLMQERRLNAYAQAVGGVPDRKKRIISERGSDLRSHNADKLSSIRKETGCTIVLVSHSMEDVANYADRIVVMDKGSVVYDDTPRNVFKHYKELKEMGLGVPQITETMYALKDAGFNVSTDIITIEDAVKEILGC